MQNIPFVENVMQNSFMKYYVGHILQIQVPPTAEL